MYERQWLKKEQGQDEASSFMRSSCNPFPRRETEHMCAVFHRFTGTIFIGIAASETACTH